MNSASLVAPAHLTCIKIPYNSYVNWVAFHPPNKSTFRCFLRPNLQLKLQRRLLRSFTSYVTTGVSKNGIVIVTRHLGSWYIYGCKYSRKSKDPTLPFGSRESFTWILRKTILCLVLDFQVIHMGVSKNRGTPKSSILIGFSIINHPFWGYPYFRKHPYQFFHQLPEKPSSRPSRKPWRKKIAWLRLGD